MPIFSLALPAKLVFKEIAQYYYYCSAVQSRIFQKSLAATSTRTSQLDPRNTLSIAVVTRSRFILKYIPKYHAGGCCLCREISKKYKFKSPLCYINFIFLTGCGGNISAPNGTISSPNYPLDSPINLYCVWRVTVAHGNTVSLFFNYLSLQNTIDCSADYVEVLDASPSGLNLIGRYCGLFSRPEAVVSRSNELLVRFSSNSTNQERRFLITHSTLSDSKCSQLMLVERQYYITLHYITLHYTTLHYITLHYITLHYITLHYITLHYITLHYITLHYITLHYITLH